jgi:hypothetical protein
MNKMVSLLVLSLAVLLFACSGGTSNNAFNPKLNNTTSNQVTHLGSPFQISVAAGERIKVNVDGTGGFVSAVIDPFGNIIGQSPTKQVDKSYRNTNGDRVVDIHYLALNGEPWSFAFVGASAGTYTIRLLGVHGERTMTNDAVQITITRNP